MSALAQNSARRRGALKDGAVALVALAALAALGACGTSSQSASSPPARTSTPTSSPSPVSSATDASHITTFAQDPNVIVRRIRLSQGSAPSGVAVGRDAVWVVEHRAHDVIRIDPRSGKITAHVPVPVGTGNIEDAPIVTRDHVLLCIYGGVDKLVRISTTTNKVDGVLKIPCEGQGNGPVGMWVAGGSRLSQIEPDRLAVAKTFPLSGVPGDVGCDIAEAGGSVWLACGDGHVLRVDPHSGKLLAEWRFGGGNLAVTDGRSMYFANPVDHTIQVIDVATNKVARHVLAPGLDEGAPVLTYGDGALWLSTLTGGLARMDPTTLAVTSSAQLDQQDYEGEVGVGFGHVWFPTYGDDAVLEVKILRPSS